MKIKIDLSGGLGNQMFQYAFGRSMSVHYKADLFINEKPILANPERKYMLEKMFNILPKNDFQRDYNLISEVDPYTEESEIKYYNLDSNKNFHFLGYWQNENFFKKYENIIREDFYLEPKKTSENPLVIQVRRGDFVGNKSHEFCDLDWYLNAISIMSSLTKFDSLIISTDDIEWTQNNFKNLDYPIFWMGLDEKETFEHMISAKNFIISNSSFGWWGAWLSKPKNVICPKIWFPANSKWNTSCKNWIKI
jgi:hypothetical protein